MCGRFTLTAGDLGALAKEWAAEVEEVFRAGWRPRFNVAPGDLHPVLVAAPGAPGRRRLISATFGWRGAGPRAAGGLLVNAREETAGTLPAFREAFRARRAAVAADGFFEWEGPPAGRRPTWFQDGGRILWFGALLSTIPVFQRRSSFAGPERGGGSRASASRPSGAIDGPGFVILTTEARAPVRALHDRMPLVIPPAALDAWLAGPPPALPAPEDGALEARRVSERVNSVHNDDAACLAPAAPPAQGSLF